MKESKVIVYEDPMYFECQHCQDIGETDSAWLFNEYGEYNYCPRCGYKLDWSDYQSKTKE